MKTKYPSQPQVTRDQLIVDYLPLVRHVLGRLPICLPSGLDRDDLYSVGVCGLIHAADTYDPNKGAAFKTYSFVTIRGAILDELRRHDPVPRSRREKLKLMDRAAGAIKERLHRDATPEEMAQELGVSLKQIEKDLLAMHTVSMLSLEDDQGDEGDLRQMLEAPDARDPGDEVTFREDVDRLADGIANLPETERKVVILYYYEELLLREIGVILGVSESRISQILTSAHLHLQQNLKD